MLNKKQYLFDELVKRVQACNLCTRMGRRNKVLSSLNGSLQSPIVFIAEAPGRLGADKYGIPLYGDQTGRNFEVLLDSAGLDRKMVFVTNAVLCNPRTYNGNNDTPTISEIRSCHGYLLETLEIIKPKCIATLGRLALSSLNIMSCRDIRLSEKVGQIIQWNGYVIYPLFHPGPRALVHRNLNEQIKDYRKLIDYVGNIINESAN